MPKIITDQQVRMYNNNRKIGKSQRLAAAIAGISERRGRDIEKNMRKLKNRKQQETNNPIDKVFESIIVPLLEENDFQATFLLEHIQNMFSVEEYPHSLLRTLQRRKREWEKDNRRLKSKEVMFPQEHTPGVLAVCDFTHPRNKARITIKGKPFKHKIFHIRLAYSGLSYAQAFEGTGESFEKLAVGLNNGLEYFGGVPERLRTDSLSAAFRNLTKKDKEDQTRRYNALIEHYGLEAKRINRGKAHENGSVESPHGHLKEYLRQSLAIRKSSDFDSFEEYQAFILEIIEKRNRRLKKAPVAAERAVLKPLPSAKAVEYTEVSARVSSSSMIRVKKGIYTVSDTLIGETLHVRLYSDKLECYLGQHHVATLNRVHGTAKSHGRNIKPKHLVKWLAKKPQAFRHYMYREDLLANHNYNLIWEHIDQTMEERAACKLLVRLLKLGYGHGCEKELADYILDRIANKKELNINYLESKFIPQQEPLPSVEITQHTLSSYNTLITEGTDNDNDE